MTKLIVKGKEEEKTVVLVDESISVAGRPLPLVSASASVSEKRSSDSTKKKGICTKDYNNNTKATATATTDKNTASIVLFYQYKEPIWTKSEYSKALKLLLKLGRNYNITGRGRIAPEGVNCTFTSSSSTSIRQFCQSLRDEWDLSSGSDNTNTNNNSDKLLFHDTDFKITDGLEQSQTFKSLSIRKTTELVAYGLEGDKAPSITKFGGIHLTAIDYHKALQDSNTVVIDVRNNFETQIGTIIPPKGGATLIDPKLRNSREYPKWLASAATQKQLHGKKILTFCTGGIRCERATALINQLSTVSSSVSTTASTTSNAVLNSNNTTATTTVNSTSTSLLSKSTETTTDINTNDDTKSLSSSFQPNGVYHMRGGIERYLKTYPQGGYWSGKNYLFDKRMEQTPALKPSEVVEQEILQLQSRGNNNILNAKCCLCYRGWTSYRHQYKCQQIQCGVPVLVCDTCHRNNQNQSNSKNSEKKVGGSEEGATKSLLICKLCLEGYRAPQGNLDYIALRRKAEKKLAVTATAMTIADEKDKTTVDNDDNTTRIVKDVSVSLSLSKKKKEIELLYPPRKLISDRLFISRLPLTVTKTQLEQWVRTPIRQYHWLRTCTGSCSSNGSKKNDDNNNNNGCTTRIDRAGGGAGSGGGSFYGSCIIRVDVFSKLLVTIKKKTKNNNNGTVTFQRSDYDLSNMKKKQNVNISGGKVRELLGLFPTNDNINALSISSSSSQGNRGSSRKRKRNNKKKKQQQQPKIFRVFAKQKQNSSPVSDGEGVRTNSSSTCTRSTCEGDVWPPPNHCQTEYPPIKI